MDDYPVDWDRRAEQVTDAKPCDLGTALSLVVLTLIGTRSEMILQWTSAAKITTLVSRKMGSCVVTLSCLLLCAMLLNQQFCS